MTKFSAMSANDLRTKNRDIGRKIRKVLYVVFVEADDGSWFELDATDAMHAVVLANNQVDKMNARGASCWQVNGYGKLSRNPIHMVFPDHSGEGMDGVF